MIVDPIIVSLLVRLLVPLLIFRWRFTGYLAAILADSWGDCLLVDLLGGSFGSGANYQAFDKWLDLYMITIAVIVSLRFAKIEKWTSVILYSIRVIGVILFEITQLQTLLVFFPNVFDFFFLFIVIVKKFWPNFRLTKKNIWLVLIALTISKSIQEVSLHYFGFDQFFWNLWLKIKITVLSS